MATPGEQIWHEIGAGLAQLSEALDEAAQQQSTLRKALQAASASYTSSEQHNQQDKSIDSPFDRLEETARLLVEATGKAERLRKELKVTEGQARQYRVRADKLVQKKREAVEQVDQYRAKDRQREAALAAVDLTAAEKK